MRAATSKPSAKRGSKPPCVGPAKHPRAQLPSSTRGTIIEKSSDAAATAATAAGLVTTEAHLQPAPPAITWTIKDSVTSNGSKTTAVEEAEETEAVDGPVLVEAAEAVDQHPDDETQPATATAPRAQASTEVCVGSRVEESDGTRGQIVARNGAWLTMRTDAGEERSVRRMSVAVIAADERGLALALLVGCEVAGGEVPSVPLRAAATEEPAASTEPAATADVDRRSWAPEVLREAGDAVAAAARAAAAAARAAAAAVAAPVAAPVTAVAGAGAEAGEMVGESGGGKGGVTTKRKDVGGSTAKGGAADGGAAAEAQADTGPHRRNEEPARIVECGFVEAPALLPAATCDKLYGLDRSAAVLISNARQLSVQGAELRLVESALEQSDVVRQTVLAVFGTEEFIVPKDSLKVGGPRHAHPMPHAPCRMPCASCPVPGAEV